MLRIIEESTEPITGMDLKKYISKKTPHKWAPSPGSIYPILNSLEKDQIIELVETEDRKNKFYVISDIGKELIKVINEESIAFKPKYEHLISNPKFIEGFRKRISKLPDDEIKNRIKTLNLFTSILEEVLISKNGDTDNI